MPVLTRQQLVLKLAKLGRKVNLLGVDAGTEYVGVSYVVDAFGEGSPSPYKTLKLSKEDSMLELTAMLNCVDAGVVGWPLDKNQLETESCKTVDNFLTTFSDYDWVKENEYNSSHEGNGILHQINPLLCQNKDLQDQVAACIILHNFMGWSRDFLSQKNVSN